MWTLYQSSLLNIFTKTSLRGFGERPRVTLASIENLILVQSSRNLHARSHAGVREVCSLCGRGFSTRGSLHRHSRTHTGSRPYSCTHCKFAFRDPGSLARHLRCKSKCVGFNGFGLKIQSTSFALKKHLLLELSSAVG